MWVTCCSPSARTRPRVIVVFPAAESPTTPTMTGRGIAKSSRLAAEDGAAQDVLRLDRDQFLRRRPGVAFEQARRLAQPRPVDRVAHAARVGEPRLGDPPLGV